MWVDIGKRDELQGATSENKGTYRFVRDRVRIDDAPSWIALFTIFRIFLVKNPV